MELLRKPPALRWANLLIAPIIFFVYPHFSDSGAMESFYASQNFTQLTLYGGLSVSAAVGLIAFIIYGYKGNSWAEFTGALVLLLFAICLFVFGFIVLERVL